MPAATLLGPERLRWSAAAALTAMPLCEPVTADHLSLSGPSSVAAGTAFDLTVTVLDAYDNVVTGYTGTVTFSSSDSAPALPSDYTFTADDAGTHVFSSGVILSDLNDMATVTAADTLDPTILGTLPLSVQ